MSCGGSSDYKIQISTGACGATKYLYVSKGSCGKSQFKVDSGECGGKVEASADDIARAFSNIRRDNW